MKNESKKEEEIWKSSLSGQVVWKADTKMEQEERFSGGGDGLPVHFSVKGRFCQRALGRKSLKLHCSPGKASLMETLELRLPSEELHVRKE